MINRIFDYKSGELIYKFIFVGILNTVFGYSLFALLIYLQIFYLLALTISHLLATFNSYLWNRFFTFKSKNRIQKELVKFLIIYTSIYILNFLLLYIWVDLFNINPLISQLFILVLVTTISFLGQRYLVFKRK